MIDEDLDKQLDKIISDIDPFRGPKAIEAAKTKIYEWAYKKASHKIDEGALIRSDINPEVVRKIKEFLNDGSNVSEPRRTLRVLLGLPESARQSEVIEAAVVEIQRLRNSEKMAQTDLKDGREAINLILEIKTMIDKYLRT